MSAVAHANLPPTIRRWRQRFLNASNKVVTKQNAATEFPLSSYLSLHLLFSTYLLFSFILLPRSDSLIGDSQSSSYGTPVQKVSTDRPEHPFLTPITNDPLKTMTWTAIGVTVTVVWWGGHLRSWWKHELQKQKAAAVSAVDTDVGQGLAYRIESGLSEKLGAVKTGLLTVLGATPVVSAILVVMGAPVDSHLPLTLLLALQLSLLAVYPVIHALGLPNLYASGTLERYRLSRLLCELDLRAPLERATVYPIYATLIGAWFGVIPLALDWERPWQAYPLTIAFGALVGNVLGGLLSFAKSAVEEVEAAAREQGPAGSALDNSDRSKEGLGGRGISKKSKRRGKVE